MKFEHSLADGIGLQISSGPSLTNGYPTSLIQKGWLLSCDGQDLSEEAVGFGVPIIKRGLQTIFPGRVELSADEASQPPRILARFTLNLEEKLTNNGKSSINNPLIYAAKNELAGMIRGFPRLRKTLTAASSLVRERFKLHTTYELSDFSTEILLSYTVLPSDGILQVYLSGYSASSARISELVLMNEQGARHFDQYQEDGGKFRLGDQIGCWDEVIGSAAAFTSKGKKISFSLPRIEGARLFHGRELVGSRLAWAGFGYSIPPGLKDFRYEIAIRRLA